MDILRKWYEESVGTLKVFTVLGKTFILHKGFKLTQTDEGKYHIEDVRKNDFYSEVTKKDFTVIKEYGFIKGVALLMYRRDKRRCAYYKGKIEKLYTDRAHYKKILNTNKVFYSKKIRNANDNIHNCLDLMFLYESRVKQYDYQIK